jgi:hypothetical protein
MESTALRYVAIGQRLELARVRESRIVTRVGLIMGWGETGEGTCAWAGSGWLGWLGWM